MKRFILLCLISSLRLYAGAQAELDGNGFFISLAFPEPVVRTTESGILLEAEGIRNRFAVGEPVLPARTLLIPVPPGAEPVLDYSVISRTALRIPSDLMICPIVSGEGLDIMLEHVSSGQGPAEHVILSGVIPLAGSQVAVVQVFPAIGIRPVSWASELSISITWEYTGRPVPVPEGHPARVFAGENAQYWPSGSGERTVSDFWGMPWARLSITGTGAYVLTGAELENNGCSATGVPVSSVSMYTGPGTEFSEEPEAEHFLEDVSILIDDLDGDGVFDTEDRILFLGRSLNRWEYSGPLALSRLFHRYARCNVYWLTWGGGSGERIQPVPATPDGSPGWGSIFDSRAWLEEDTSWKPTYENRTGWIWMSCEPGGNVTVPFSLEDPHGPGSISIFMIVSVGGNNDISIRLNGAQVASDSWYGVGQHTTVVTGVSLEATNTLEITYQSGASGSSLSLDYVDIDYERGTGNAGGSTFFPSIRKTGRFVFDLQGTGTGCRIFDVTGFSTPSELEGIEATSSGVSFALSVDGTTSFIVVDPGDWSTPDSIRSASPGRLLGTVTGGDRLVVVSEELLDGAWGIDAVLRESGRLPVVATTREIYDEFGQGVTDPGAIRSAVRWGIDSWIPGFGGVLLIGDGHYDYLGISTSIPVQIPPWIETASGSSGTICFDDYYVMVHEDAVLPEIPVARIPADNGTELGTCTAKTLTYNSGTAVGTWMNRCMVVADDEWGGDNQMNEAIHTEQCELIVEEALPYYLDRIKFYLIEYPWPPGTPSGPHPLKPEARADFITALSEGMAAVIYIGHGSADQIAHEKMLLSEDVDLLTNGSRLSLSIWATCDVGHFDTPGSDAIAEDLVNHPSGGSIAAIACTRGCYSWANYELGRAILDSLYSVPGLTMGEALWLAKVTEPASYMNNNRFYIILGYPDFPIPDTDSGASLSIEGDTLRSGESNTISGSGYPETGLAWLELKESSALTYYICLGGAVIEYLKYGGPAFRGTVLVQLGQFVIDCIVPIQAETGPWARAAAACLSSSDVSAGALDPAVMVTGNPPGDDFSGPFITMWIQGHKGVEEPVVTGEVVLEAELEDSSGICFLGGEGRQLRLFVNGDGMDVGRFFNYNQGSSTKGRLVVELQNLAAGEYTLILQALDGVGNASTDTLILQTLDQNEIAITEAIVFPNPGYGQRCFSFRLSTASSVSVSIYTVSGRRIRTLSSFCEQGYNQIIWDGHDTDGDELASGSYIYRIRATSVGSSVFDNETDSTGILAVVRE